MSEKAKDGGQAFPCARPELGWADGMTLRDYFAAAALQGMLSNEGVSSEFTTEAFEKAAPKAAYALADRMLEARANN